MTPAEVGKQAGWMLTSVVLLLHVGFIFWQAFAPGGLQGSYFLGWVAAIVGTLILWPIAALVVTFFLPRGAGGPFWAVTSIALGVTVVLSSATCGVAVANG